MDHFKNDLRQLSRVRDLKLFNAGCKKCYNDYIKCTQKMHSTICSTYFAVCMQQCYENDDHLFVVQ
jgi:hypothetical protein